MSKFITGKELINTIDSIIWDAEKTLLIVCPYIKLDSYFKDNFKRHLKNPQVEIIVVFGKNENEIHKSLSKSDFEFFKNLPNVSIIYEPKLHAKYYGNEKKGVVTSLNLYEYSVDNNIEFGVFSEQTLLTQLSNSNHDLDAWHKCKEIADKGKVVYIKRPVYENKKFIISLGKNYIESKILLDDTEYFYEKKRNSFSTKKLPDFPDEIDLEDVKPVREEKPVRGYKTITSDHMVEHEAIKNESPKHGYCIRTGEQIPFNTSRPFSYKAWKIWNEYGDMDFPEKYCHVTGKFSNGKTSFRNPILN